MKRKPIMLYKACPRCKGDLRYEPFYHEYHCLQCGHTLPNSVPPNRERPSARASTLIAIACVRVAAW